MAGNKARVRRLQRELDKRAPAEPLVIRFVWYDEATGEEEEWDRMVVVDGRAQQSIQLRWPEDEDDEKRARDVAPGRA